MHSQEVASPPHMRKFHCWRVAYFCKEDHGQADSVPNKALHDSARAIDEAAARADIARQHHLRSHLQLQYSLALHTAST